MQISAIYLFYFFKSQKITIIFFLCKENRVQGRNRLPIKNAKLSLFLKWARAGAIGRRFFCPIVNSRRRSLAAHKSEIYYTTSLSPAFSFIQGISPRKSESVLHPHENRLSDLCDIVYFDKLLRGIVEVFCAWIWYKLEGKKIQRSMAVTVTQSQLTLTSGRDRFRWVCDFSLWQCMHREMNSGVSNN